MYRVYIAFWSGNYQIVNNQQYSNAEKGVGGFSFASIRHSTHPIFGCAFSVELQDISQQILLLGALHFQIFDYSPRVQWLCSQQPTVLWDIRSGSERHGEVVFRSLSDNDNRCKINQPHEGHLRYCRFNNHDHDRLQEHRKSNFSIDVTTVVIT